MLAAVLATNDATNDAQNDAQSDRAKSTRQSGVDALAVPLLSFNSDVGVGYGAAGGAIIYGKGYFPYKYSLSAQVFFTTHGIQSHFIHIDAPNLIGPVRIESKLEYRHDLFAPYFGPGNESSPGVIGNRRERQFSYDLHSPTGMARARWRPLGDATPLEVSAGYMYEQITIKEYGGSLLSEQNPIGVLGGPNGMVLYGISWDTRDFETNPSKGAFYELAFRSAGSLTGSRYAYSGITLNLRQYVPIGDKVVFAQRVVADFLLGNVPFYEWSRIEGPTTIEAIGGMTSVRGVPRQRFQGDFKVISNSEVRYNFWGFPLLKQRVDLGVVGLVDLGRVWQPGIPDGPWYQWHPGVGAGLRAARRAAVARLDWGLDTENGRQAIYITFGQMF